VPGARARSLQPTGAVNMLQATVVLRAAPAMRAGGASAGAGCYSTTGAWGTAGSCAAGLGVDEQAARTNRAL
jgi:hypothetical protein